MTRLARAALVMLVVSTLSVLAPPRVEAVGPTITGAGSTWVQIALDQWRADIARYGYSVNYQGVGSSAGRSFYIIRQVDFAATEIPFQPDEVSQLQSAGRSYQYLPDVAGGTSLMYNLHTPSGSRIGTLRLDAVTAAKIFTGVITSWQDPAIAALNPGLSISETTVVPVVRSDGSGTSAQFSLYLQTEAGSVWGAFLSNYGCPAPCSQWPAFPGSTQQAGSDGVANFVANDALASGSIGYVEAGYAYGRNFPVANLKNASGNFTQPTAKNVATALAHATLHSDLTQDLTGTYAAPEANAYPMSSYSYMVTPTSGFDPAKGAVLGTWLIYIACAGQKEAAPLGYSPLPPNLIQAVFDAVHRIPGAPATPPVDAAHCPNPTLSGGVPNNGPGTSNAGATAGSSSSGGSSGTGTHGGTRTAAPSASHGNSSTAAAPGAQTAGIGPSATSSASAAAGSTPGPSTAPGSGSGSASASTSAAGVATLGDEDRQALLQQAALAAAGATPRQTPVPLILVAAVLALLLTPMIARRRARGPEE